MSKQVLVRARCCVRSCGWEGTVDLNATGKAVPFSKANWCPQCESGVLEAVPAAPAAPPPARPVVTAADKLRELLATRPAMPDTVQLVRWWRTTAELVPQVLAELERHRHVTPEYIREQRAKGWPDIHPEDYCHRCGASNMSWFADRKTWLEATADWSAETGREGICCPRCFAEMHEARTGKQTTWLVAGTEYRTAVDYAENMAGRPAPDGFTLSDRIRFAAQAALSALTKERAKVEVLEQEARELEQQRDAHRASLNRIADSLRTVHEDDKIERAVKELREQLAATTYALKAARQAWCPVNPGGDGADGETYALVSKALQKAGA